jgi:RHS repeat-associated protein
LISYYNPDIISADDYYPFGMISRHYGGLGYRFGFNGKENDKDVKGYGNQQDYGMRIYDPRIGKFLSVDPIAAHYPELTPYQFASNNPIENIDLDGLEGMSATTCGVWSPVTGRMMVQGDINNDMVVDQSEREAWMGAMGITMVAGAAATADIAFTKGKASQFLFFYVPLAGAFEHNRAKTPEGKAAQDQRSKESLTTASLGWGFGKIIEGVGSLLSEAKAILFSKYAYGETTIKTKVGNEAKEVGKGGIGPGGYLELEINVKQGANGAKVANGEDVFNALYQSIKTNANAPINGIRGIWTPGELGDNLSTFNKLIIEKVNTGKMTLNEAALETFTGKMAKNNGFTSVKSISGEKNADGTYKFVNSIIFGK